jgi:hypothetical protein
MTRWKVAGIVALIGVPSALLIAHGVEKVLEAGDLVK